MGPGRLGVRLLMRAFAGIPMPPRALTVYRAVFNGQHPLDASYSLTYVGRWHNPATTAALYTSVDRQTALHEKTAHLDPGRYALTIAEIQADVPAVLDLTDPDVIVHLPFPLGRCLADTGVALLRGAVLGDAAFALGACALIVPCVRGPAPCVPLFTGCPRGIRLAVTATQAIEVTVNEG